MQNSKVSAMDGINGRDRMGLPDFLVEPSFPYCQTHSALGAKLELDYVHAPAAVPHAITMLALA